MSSFRWVAVKAVKIVLGIVIGLFFSFCTIVGLDYLLPGGFIEGYISSWLVESIIAGWLLVWLLVMLGIRKSKKIKIEPIENLPTAIAELVGAIIDSMGYRRSVRAEVQQELTDHFCDMMKDCQTGEERAKRAEDIIKEFGDVKMLGKLIRRGKKRCRPLWRTMVVRCFQVIGVMILLLIVQLVLFVTGKPDISIDYVARFNEMARPVADDSLNAAPFYEKAVELVTEEPKDLEKLRKKGLKELTADERAKVVEWINSNKEALEQVRLGNKKPYCWKEYRSESGELIGILMPGLGASRDLGRALSWRALILAEEGKYEESFEDIKSCYKFGRHLKGGPTLIEQLVGMAMENMATDTLRRVLDENDINFTTLADMQRGYGKMIAGERFTADVKWERLLIYDEIQRCYTGKRLGGLRAGKFCLAGVGRIMTLADGDEGLGILARLSLVPYAHPNREECRVMADRYYSFWEEIAQKSPAQIRAEGIDVGKRSDEMVKGNILLEILAPALRRMCEHGYKNRVDVEATGVVLAVLRYERENKDYSESLAALVEVGLLKEIPIDPFSDKPLVYRKGEDGFMLYSVGKNFIDDGGVRGVYEGTNKNPSAQLWVDNGDAVFWPVAE